MIFLVRLQFQADFWEGERTASFSSPRMDEDLAVAKQGSGKPISAMRLLFLFLSFATTALAQTVVIEAYPGCFLGPKRHTVSLSSESPPLVTLYREDGGKQEPAPAGTIEQSKQVIQQLLALELSQDEIGLLRNLDIVFGPAHYEIKVTLADRAWEVRYPGHLVGQTLEKKKLGKYDGPTLAMIEKLDKIHAIVAEFSPKEGK